MDENGNVNENGCILEQVLNIAKYVCRLEYFACRKVSEYLHNAIFDITILVGCQMCRDNWRICDI